MQTFGIKKISNSLLIDRLKNLVQSERKISAEIVDAIREIDLRKLYLDLGHTSLFAFLTDELGYSPGSAQRRIDAARIAREIPELKEDLRSGNLNLSQISMLAHCVRQKQREEPGRSVSAQEKRELLQQVQRLDQVATEKIFAKGLDLEVKITDRKHIQKDDSVRMEVTFSKEQMVILERVKELVSHQLPNPSLAELLTLLGRDFLKRKDPLLKQNRKSTSATAVPAKVKPARSAIKAAVRRAVHRRNPCCQWKNGDGSVCGSKFQLQLDHVKPIWAGGGNEAENLQMLCAKHNRFRYSIQTRTRCSKGSSKIAVFGV